MRTLAALVLVLAACGGTKKTPISESTAGDVAAETCCCKSNPLTSEDGQPIYESGNRMECSSTHSPCFDEVQCQASAQPE